MFDIFNTVNEEMSAEEHMRNRESAQQPAQAAPFSNSAQSSDLFVVSIGGSLIVDEAGPNAEKIRVIAETISSLHSSGKRIAVVVGGGRTARAYVEAARAFTQNNFELDLTGIQATRANAALLASALPNAHREILADLTMAKAIIDAGKIPVFGGLMPFFTTDSVAALLAECLQGVFVNLTNVDGIYDSNPSENPEAKRFDEIGYGKLVSLIVQAGSRPGQNVVLDLACCMILRRSKIPGVVLNGNDMPNFSNYVNGYQFVGTTIRDIEGEPVPEENLLQKMDEINVDIPQKKPRKKNAKKGKKGYEPPNPYQIDF